MKRNELARKWLPAVALGLTLAFSSANAGSAPAGDEDVPVKGAFDDYDKHGDEHPAAAGDAARSKAYSPYAGKSYPMHVYFGDTHNHTANSGDAYMAGNSLTPEQAYRFARGEEVVSSTGVPVRLSRPLDFLVVSDHAEGLGIMFQVQEGNPALVSDPVAAQWSKVLKTGTPEEKAAAQSEVVKAQAMGTLPKVFKDPKVVGPLMMSVWQQYTATAEKFNEPGRFTAMIGYEWTSVPGGNNLHRNVLFRDGKDKADQVFPFSAWNSEDPEKLWEWMAKYEQKTGGKLLAIPHNANLSNGRMFELVDFGGNPLSKDYAERRARWEVLQEIVQTKGNSETHPTLSPNDEFAGDLGVAGWEYGNLTLTDSPLKPGMLPTNYLRGGLLRGLELESKLGVNPFKFGVVGSTDVHNSLTSIEEDNFFGKMPIQEPSPKRWEHKSKQSDWDAKLGPTKSRYTWHYLSAGYAAVWAVDNTREALWDAMKRREAYGTSGSRMTVRFFGGWHYRAADARARDAAGTGYAKGVPMGSDLPKAPAGAKAPTFLVAAMKDPLSGNLDRIQIVKGWLDKNGKGREKIYNVVWGDADRRKIGADGKLTPVGDTVDVANATWKDTIGDPQLAAVWTDPAFDPSVRAFYYARVIEIPTPRWTAYDALRFGVKMPPEVPMKQRERAWSSPIWYTPGT
ncbi:MAG: DUF3604 domain-containing protein [Desulfobacterales bacterium]|nr:DUF3604 domain-containing protein [Desulfobacterales bacterium]